MKSKPSAPAKAGTEANRLVTVNEVAEQVGREILESRLDPGAWATALYECGGDREEALALYARLRVRQLTAKRRVRLAKVRSLETRRLEKCMGDQDTRAWIARTIQEMLHSDKRGQNLNFMKPRLSLIWLFVLFIGAAGTTACLGRLFAGAIPGRFADMVTPAALFAGMAAVTGVLVLRFFLPKRWIMLGWNHGLVLACNVVCLSSLYLGTKVIQHSMATDTTAHGVRQAAPVLVRPAVPKPAAAVGSTYLASSESTATPPGN